MKRELLITKHIKRIGLSCSNIIIVLMLVSCGDTNSKTYNQVDSKERLEEINKLRSRGVECNNIYYPMEHNLTKVDNCLGGAYAYTSSIQINTMDILKSLDNDLDCSYIFGHYVQYVNFDNDLINTCGSPPIDQ